MISKKGFLRTRTGHGHDCSLMSFKMGDQLDRAIECRSSDQLSFLDAKGRVYSLAVSQLPGGRSDGAPLSAFVDLPRGFECAGWLAGPQNTAVLLATSGGKGMILRLSDVSTRLKAGRDFVKMSEGERLLPPLTVSGDAIEAGAKLACLSSSGRLLAFPLSEIRFVASGGKGVALMLLDPGEEMISMAVTDDRGAILSGTGRGGKPREAQLTERAYRAHIMHRARRGKMLEISWKAERVEALPPLSSEPVKTSDPGSGASQGLKLEVVDEAPTLL